MSLVLDEYKLLNWLNLIEMENYFYGGLSESILIFWYLVTEGKTKEAMPAFAWDTFGRGVYSYLGSHRPWWQKTRSIRPHEIATAWDRKGNCQQRPPALKLDLLTSIKQMLPSVTFLHSLHSSEELRVIFHPRKPHREPLTIMRQMPRVVPEESYM